MPIRPKSQSRPWIQKVEYNKIPGQGRKTINPFYQSREWKRLRHNFRIGISTHLGTPNPHPNCLCIDCIKRGYIVATYAIDHIKPINPINTYDTMNGKYGDPLLWENLQPLCESCHAKKSGKSRDI